MSESFKKFKKQFLISAIIKSAVVGVSLGLLVAGVMLLIIKLTGNNINIGFYFLAGIVTALVSGGATFFLLRPTDKKIAKKLDKDYGLNEKVQTMVEYAGAEGDIVSLQREDATQTLGSLPRRKPSVLKLTQYIAVAAVAVAMIFTAAFIPAVKTQISSAEEPGYSLTELQAISLRSLIEDVEKSGLDEGLSDSVIVVLNGLLDGLETIKLESTMRSAIISSITLIDGLFADATSFGKLSGEFINHDDTKPFGYSINRAIVSYRTSTKITTLKKVNENAENGDEAISAALQLATDALNENFAEASLSDISKKINLFLSAYSARLTAAELDETNALYVSHDNLLQGLVTVTENDKKGGYSAENLKQQIAEAGQEYVSSCTVALSDEMYVCMMDEFVRERLAQIFGLRSAELPNAGILPTEFGTGESEEGGDDNKPGNNNGGYGNQEVKYPSDAEIYYPDEDTHVKYGEVFDEYYAEAEERLKSGEVSDDLVKFITEYFKNLNTSKNITE